MGAERAVAVGEARHDRGDRDYRGVAGEDGIAPGRGFDGGEQFALYLEVLAQGLDDAVRIAHAGGKVGIDAHLRQRGFVVTEVPEIGEDAVPGGCERSRIGIAERHLVPGAREHLGDAVAHESVIDNLAASGKDVVYWDAACPGFGVKVTPAGRKVFVVLYRTGSAGSRLRKYTIGPYGRVTFHRPACRRRR